MLILLVSAKTITAQHATLKGNIIDTSEKKNLTNSVVALLRKSDSVLVTFTRTDKSGNFTLPHFVPGKYVIMVTHPAYADYMDTLDVKDSTPVNVGRIAMVLKSQLLQEVVVSHKLGAIRIKGDTVEYKADSFYMKAGSSVEDLLKNLPGISVDKNGKITAQGEAVQKVLVDGEEFFSDDPTIATRGLLSDAVDKVQVFDKKSDQAAFTGIDDGEKVKTIDLKLKDDKKKGYFGKLELGSNGDKYWNNNIMFNAFKAKRKFSAFGIMSTTGKTGLDWQENSNYGGSNPNMEMSDDGSMFMYMSDGDDFGGGSYWGEGFPKGWSGGLHYSNKWNGDKLHLNANYKYNKLNTEATGRTTSQYITEDSIYYVNESGNNWNSKERSRLDGIYEIQVDSSSSIKITAGGASGKSSSFNKSYTEWLDEDRNPVRTIDQHTSSTGTNKSFNSNLVYRKKFKKIGRTVSLTMNQDYKENNSEGMLYADNEYYSGGSSTQKLVDQKKINDNISSLINGKVSYTEPLTKRAILEFNYSLSNNHRQSSRLALESTDPSGGKYDQLVDSLSNDYVFNVLTQNGGINYRYAKPKKVSFSFGMNISQAGFMRKNLKADSVTRYSFTNFYPQANMNWTLPGSGATLRLGYGGSTQAPSIDQIQPVADNTDQSNIRIGNPELKQAFRHSVSLSFNQYKILSESGIWANMRFSTTQNAFSDFTTIKNGQRVSQPVNVNGNYNVNGWIDYNRKIKGLKGVNINPGISFSKNRNVNFIDGARNVNNSYDMSGNFNISYNIQKVLYTSLRPSISWNHSKSSLRPDVITKYWSQSYDFQASLVLPWKLELGTDIGAQFRQKTAAFPKNNNVIRWNAQVERKILKDDAAKIRISAFDLLNQNMGFERDISSNFISERTYDTFRRYFMVSLVWNFSKNGKPQGW